LIYKKKGNGDKTEEEVIMATALPRTVGGGHRVDNQTATVNAVSA
jgi:hypothetical protein